jgi:predicted transcriptional regulator
MVAVTFLETLFFRHLIEGLRKHLKGIGGGVTNEEINAMEQAVSQLEEANAEVDRLREELAPKVKQVNAMMVRVKEAYAEKKRTLKGYYPQERWIDYGVPDKR